MMEKTEEILNKLIQGIASMPEVTAIGISGGKQALPTAGEGDIDMFVYCDTIPDAGRRQAVLYGLGGVLTGSKTNVFSSGPWGIADCTEINGVETWVMYFAADDVLGNMEAILRGDYPDKLGSYYYPVGRLAMLKNIWVLYDRDDFLASLKERLAEYPDTLSEKLVQYHLNKLKDTEDFERAIKRKEVLFYHCTLESALDHLLQALFAVNRTYFPSRKRTLAYIEKFAKKPEGCSERLLKVIELGSCAESLTQSYEVWSALVEEFRNLV